jgi:hypothetical protein
MWVTNQPRATSFDVIKCRARPGNKVTGYCSDTSQKTAHVIEVNGKSEKTGLSKPVSLVAVVFTHATHIVQYDDTRMWFRISRLGKITPHLPPWCRNEYLGHRFLRTLHVRRRWYLS